MSAGCQASVSQSAGETLVTQCVTGGIFTLRGKQTGKGWRTKVSRRIGVVLFGFFFLVPG